MAADRPIFLVRNIHQGAFGGGETYQIALAKELEALGEKPILFTRSKLFLDAAKKQGIKTKKSLYLPLQNFSGARNLLLPLYALWQLILFVYYLILIKKYRPLALHLQSRDDLIAGTLAGRATKTRVIWTDHTDFRFVVWPNVNKKYKNPIGKFILKIAPLADKITTVSKSEYKYVTDLIAPQKLKNFIVVENGVSDRLFAYAKIKHEPESLVHVGRIVDYKGIKELIDAFLVVKKSFPRATLHLYGDGPDLPLFKSYAKKCEAAEKTNHSIFFHGYTSDPLKAIKRHDIFVLASYHEGLSLSLLDAAMLKKPIVATSIDGNPEVVKDKKTGLLVPPADSEKLAAALEKLLKNPKLAATYAKNARALYEQNFDFSRTVKTKLEPLYHEKT